MADIIKDTVQNIETKDRPVIIQTEIDAYISDAMRGGPQKPDDIQVRDYTPETSKHRMSLPRELDRKYGKKYAFRWVNKDKRMVDRALYVRKWLIANRMLFPDMPKHLFTANGTIENGDTILCFMPIEAAERLRKAPGEQSLERVKQLPMEKWRGHEGNSKSPYYKPALGNMEKDGEVFNAGIQPETQTITE